MIKVRSHHVTHSHISGFNTVLLDDEGAVETTQEQPAKPIDTKPPSDENLGDLDVVEDMLTAGTVI